MCITWICLCRHTRCSTSLDLGPSCPCVIQAQSDLPLCRTSIFHQPPSSASSPPHPSRSPPRLLLVDAYILILVIYREATDASTAAAAVPFPPPAGSALSKAIAAIRLGRRICPKVRFSGGRSLGQQSDTSGN